jgi:hypothetical protein
VTCHTSRFVCIAESANRWVEVYMYKYIAGDMHALEQGPGLCPHLGAVPVHSKRPARAQGLKSPSLHPSVLCNSDREYREYGKRRSILLEVTKNPHVEIPNQAVAHHPKRARSASTEHAPIWGRNFAKSTVQQMRHETMSYMHSS